MVAFAACIMLAGVAAAEYPDAGDTFSTAKSFSAVSGYNYIDGTLTASPADGVDYWYGNPGIGTVYVYLDGTSLGNGAVAQMYEGSSSHPLMQYVSKDQRVNYDTYLNTPRFTLGFLVSLALEPILVLYIRLKINISILVSKPEFINFFPCCRLIFKFWMGIKMLRSVFTIVILLLVTNVASANPVSEDSNLSVTPLDEILHIEEGFTTTSTEWSPDGQYLLVTYSKSDSPSNSIVKHYLLDTNSHTFGEINYGINGSDTNGILQAKWTPSGDKLYFGVSRTDETNSGYCYIICNPDGTNLRCIGTNYTDLSYIIKNLGSIGYQRNLNWNPDSGKIVFEWEKPGNHSPGVYMADRSGTNAHELPSATYPQPALYDSNRILIVTDEGTILFINDDGNLIRNFRPENKEEHYCAFSLSPDRKKIMFAAGSSGSYNLQTYISNIDGSNLKGNISYNENLWANESWQPNGSLLLVNQKGSLYIVEGNENNKRLLYEGNASEPQWFPDGKKILFVENVNKLYSIGVDGTNLSFITGFGPTYSYLWKYFGEGQHFSISLSGNLIAFMSAFDSATGRMIENNDIYKFDIAAPLFIINSSGSNLTRVTSAVKERYDTCINWSPDGKQFTIGSTIYTDPGWGHGNSSLVELDSENSSSIWKSLPVKEIIRSEESGTVDKVQINEPDSKNTSQVTESQELIKQSPSFMLLQMFTCIMGIWLLHKSKEL